MPIENEEGKSSSRSDYLGLAEKRLRSLVDISRSLSEEVELYALMALVAGRASEAMSVERTSVWLHDRLKREVWTIVAEGELRELRMPETIPEEVQP